jgi:alcohol dehydrogenase (cytochrome c)
MKLSACAAVLFLFITASADAQSLEDLKNDGKNTDNVLTYGMGYHQQRYSPLNQINKSNVKRLVPVWSLSLQNELGEQAQPLVYNGVMYVSNAKWTVAIDALTGKQLWRTAVDFVPETPRVVCCGVSNKGVALYNGKVFRTTLDAHVVALDQKTGEQVWKQKSAEWKEGYSQTVAPLIANGVLVTGISGAEFGIRGFIDGWDPDTGKKLWRTYTTAGPGEKGHDTWEPRESYLNGGASTWITGSYDPDLDLMYWGTGNAAPWNPVNRKGDNLYAASFLALRPKTGEIVWHYQAVPNDAFDWDSLWELILADIKVDGKVRKVVMQMNRNGFLYVLDRTDGTLISAKPFGKINWATHVDMATGRPVESEESKKLRAGETIEMWPSIRGAKNWPHAAFNPNTGLLYANTNHQYSKYRFIELVPFKPGLRYQGMENTLQPTKKGDVVGHIEAIDPLTAQAKWRVPLHDYQIWSAILATGGGLLFNGKHTGEFFAMDADTGQTLWEYKTSSGVNSMPITWTHKGRQYVTVLSGLGGLYGSRQADLQKSVPLGGSVWTFALMPE